MISMRLRAAPRLYLLLALSFALVASASTDAGGPSEAPESSTSSEAFGNSFVARLISVESDMGAAFIAHLSECYLPVWNQLHDDGALTAASVFELRPYDSTTTNSSATDYLVLAELGPLATPSDLMDAEKVSACPERRDIPTFSVLRSTFMSCTPNSCHGMPEPGYQDAVTGIDFLIEFIGVEDTPSALARYREIVSKYAGPANGILVERGMLHCFMALENVEILTDTPGAVPWNQLHMSDAWDESGEVDWETVYAELFRSEFSRDLDSVWAELPPTDRTRIDYRGRLVSRLCVR